MFSLCQVRRPFWLCVCVCVWAIARPHGATAPRQWRASAGLCSSHRPEVFWSQAAVVGRHAPPSNHSLMQRRQMALLVPRMNGLSWQPSFSQKYWTM